MPRSISAALDPLLSLSWLQTFFTLEVAFHDGQVKRWAGGEVQIPGEPPYVAGVIRANGLQQSMGGAVDVVQIAVTNTDWWHSAMVLNNTARTLRPAIVGRLHRDFRTGGAWMWRALLRGVVGSPVTNEEEAVYTVISDLAAAGLVGATRTMTRPCTWKYKGEECGATSSHPTCDFTYDLDTGCKGRDRQFRFNGFIFDAEKLTLTLPGYSGATPDYNPQDDSGGGVFKDYSGAPPVFGY